ncbi:MAG: DNA-binding protein [Massilia sp.]|nr:DNA-binding protein [Massilia sp.]
MARRVQRLRSLPASGPEAGAFVPGVPALDLFPAKPWRRVLDQAWRDIDPSQLNYPDVAGLLALSEEIRHYLMASRGMRCSAEQIFVTSGTQASLEICARTFADAGATGRIENPGYICALAAFRSAQLRTIGIGVDADGIRPSSQDWNLHRPKLIYTTPSHQYPTGGVLCMARRLALIEQSATAGALIIAARYRHRQGPARTGRCGARTQCAFNRIARAWLERPDDRLSTACRNRDRDDGRTARTGGGRRRLTLCKVAQVFFPEGGSVAGATNPVH